MMLMEDRIFILSADEALKLDEFARGCGFWWWLRTQGDHGKYAAYVNHAGHIFAYGHNTIHHVGVRPAFYLPLEVTKAPEVAGKRYSLVCSGHGGNLWLADEPVAWVEFGKDNEYETSRVREYLNGDYLELVRYSGVEPLAVRIAGERSEVAYCQSTEQIKGGVGHERYPVASIAERITSARKEALASPVYAEPALARDGR
jgi:hypothetical protein